MSESVVLVTLDNNVTVSKNGATATRVYLDADMLPNAVATTLPSIGDVYDENISALLVVSITTTYLADNPNCGHKYTVQYSTNIGDQSNNSDGERKQNRTFGVSAQYKTFTKSGLKDASWFEWASDNAEANDLTLKKREVLVTFNIHRKVYVLKIDQWIELVARCIGLINSDWFAGEPTGTVLFNGCSMTQYLDHSGKIRWKADLSFLRKKLDNTTPDTDTWLKEWRPEKMRYEKPSIGSGKDAAYLYKSCSLNRLTQNYYGEVEEIY